MLFVLRMDVRPNLPFCQPEKNALQRGLAFNHTLFSVQPGHALSGVFAAKRCPHMQPDARYTKLSAYFRSRFGTRAQKIPLDIGAGCPNRDGVVSTQGCIFCNLRGSGTGSWKQGLGLERQWAMWKTRFDKRYADASYIAYLQSFSNTYMPVPVLRERLDEICTLPGIAGLAVGTRPDCLDDERLGLVAACRERLGDEIWLDLGLQSSNDATLVRINRGHDFTAWADTCVRAHDAGIKVCVHVVAGLPGEDASDVLRTVRDACALPVAGIKFHNLLVVRGSGMVPLWRRGAYEPLAREEYVDMLCQALPLVPAEVVIHRLHADPAPGELLAPAWAGEKHAVRNAIEKALEERDVRQGSNTVRR
ncbi:TIGR01212 family radical SAM protein [Oceanidesulfovibrio marinus]|uniref:TIGR01212 family radical SAM protein n=2 Tax=Oceanidesulfovibrio marinus TaxID=370038 RepID=A0ABX6NH42_9BACT|nr:TIGR01212 family radical SAM protein [Oceanidesulfovibrio marinus]